jgi:DDE superfamily endonuclease
LPERSVVLVEDESDLLLFPPLRAMWSLRGEQACVMLSGRNARRVVFGCMNLVTGHRVFLVRERQRADDFQAFLREVRQHYSGWHIVMLLDADGSHIASASRGLARRLHIRLLWLPKRSPELNPMDTLWGQAKDVVCVNTQYADIDEQVDAFIAHLSGLSNRQALQTSGVLSAHFWLRRTLSSYFCGPA